MHPNKTPPITSTNFAVTIPPSIGPSGSFYAISMERNSDPDKDGPSGFQYSNTFTLEGGTSKWSPAELTYTGSGFADPDLTPCSAFNCARECSEEKGQEALDGCVEKCPEVEKPVDEGDIDTGDGEGTAIGSATVSGKTARASSSAGGSSTSGAGSVVATTATGQTSSATGSSGGTAG